MKLLARGNSWPLALLGALCVHGGLALGALALPGPTALPEHVAFTASLESPDETHEIEAPDLEVSGAATEELSNAAAKPVPPPPRRLARMSPPLSGLSDDEGGFPTVSTDATAGPTLGSGVGEPSATSGLEPRRTSRRTAGATRASLREHGLTRSRGPQLRGGSACNDLFASIGRRDATSVLVHVDVSSQGRARLQRLVSAADDPELARASATCVSRLRFAPALDELGRASAGLATLRLRLVGPG